MTFLFALAGSAGGILAGPYIVRTFPDSPAWLLPALLSIAMLLALVAAYLAFRLAGRDRSGTDGHRHLRD